MEEVKLYKKPNKGLKLLICCTSFVVIGLLLINNRPQGSSYILELVGICFFGLGIPIALFQIFDKRPQIILNENGIWDRTTKQNEIKWEQIIEAYPIDIFGQKFISLVTSDTLIFKNKQYKWASKLSEEIGAQKLNLHIGQIDIDANYFAEIIKRLSKASKNERSDLIRQSYFNTKTYSLTKFQKYILYALISIVLLLFSIESYAAFWVIMITTGIAAVICWWLGPTSNPNLLKYSSIITYLGFINMVFILLTFKAYDHTTNKIGLTINNEVMAYKNKFGVYPNNLEVISGNLEFNIVQRYFLHKVEYTKTENDYSLQLETLNNKQKKFNTYLNEWR